MKGLASSTIRIVLVTFIGLFLALTVLSVGFTGSVGDIFKDGVNNTKSSGCDYQRNQFFQGNANLGALNENCITEEKGEDVDMKELQENVQIIRCMNGRIEETGSSDGLHDIDLENCQ